MLTWLIALGIFLVVAVVLFKFVFKNPTLENFSLDSQEKIAFEDKEVKIAALTGPRQRVFPKCLVRATSKRLIIAQYPLLKNAQKPLLYVIYYNFNQETPNGYGGGALQKGYVTFVKNSIRTISKDGVKYIEIVPQGQTGPLSGKPFYLNIFTSQPEKYMGLEK